MIETLLNSLWQGALIVAVGAGLTAFVPERHAATRYAVWFAALIALVLLPLSGLISFGQAASAIPGSVVRPASIASHVAEQAASANGLWFAAAWIWEWRSAWRASRSIFSELDGLYDLQFPRRILAATSPHPR